MPIRQEPARKGKPAKHAEPLQANPLNPRKPWESKEQEDAFSRSLLEFGDLSGVVLNVTTKCLVGGHKRVERFKAGGYTITVTERLPKPDSTGTVAYGHIETDGVRFAYREVKWNAQKEKAAMLAANQWSAEWDTDLLSGTLRELAEEKFDMPLLGFDSGQLEDILSPVLAADDGDKDGDDKSGGTRPTGPRQSDPDYSLFELVMLHTRKIRLLDALSHAQKAKGLESKEEAIDVLVDAYNATLAQ